MASPEHIAADRRPPVGTAMTYLVGGTPRTGRVCYYQRGTGAVTWQVQDDQPPWVWRCLYLGSKDIVEPAQYGTASRTVDTWVEQ